MTLIKIIGIILTGIGAILIGIVGIVLLAGYEVIQAFYGISLLVLGLGLALGSIYVLCKKCLKKEKKQD